MAVFTDPPAREPPISIMDVIKEDGSITLLSNQVFSTTGKTRSELENEIRSYYAPRFSTNSVCLCNTDPPVYCVRGEVNSPGLQIRMRPTTVLKAVQSAGGFSQSANKKKVQLIRHGTKFIVNCAKAQQDSTADMEVVADDKIVVPRSVWK